MIKTAIRSFFEAFGYSVLKTSSLQTQYVRKDNLQFRLEELDAIAASRQDRINELERGGLKLPFVCPACGNHTASKVLDHRNGDLASCLACGAQMIWPLPSNEELNAIYSARNEFTNIGDGDVERYRSNPDEKRGHAQHIDRILKQFNQPADSTIVEVGCMHGLVMLELSKLGYNCIGLDPSPEGIEFLNRNGGRGFCGTLFDNELPFQQVNAIVGYHVLEHLPDPYAALKRIHKLLTPGGLINIIVPYWGGLVAQRQLEHWKWFAPPYHLHYFTEKSLLTYLRGVGFRVEVCTGVTGDHEVDELQAAYGLVDQLSLAERATSVALMRKLRLGEALEVTALRT